MSNRQFESDLTNPSYYQEEEQYYSDADADAFYNCDAKPSVTPNHDAGIAPNKMLVAQALVGPLLKGHVSRDASTQEKLDAIYYIAKHEKIPYGGQFMEWGTDAYAAEVWEMALAMIEHCS